MGHEPKESLTTLVRNVLNLGTFLTAWFIGLLDGLFPKDGSLLLFKSYPDIDDNALALYRFVIGLPSSNSVRIVWHVHGNIQRARRKLIANAPLTAARSDKVVLSASPLGVYYYWRAKFVFMTHGLYMGARIPTNHIVINLWHGMTLKRIGLLDGKSRCVRSTYAIATGKMYAEVMAAAFGLPTDRVLITGQPRCDRMLEPVSRLERAPWAEDDERLVLWLPTYRSSKFGDIRTDGHYENALPVLSAEDLRALDRFLKSTQTRLVVKLHPMDSLNDIAFPQMENITIINRCEADRRSLNINGLLAMSDLLLTDYSSVWVDYLLLDRPIGFFMSDVMAFTASRGFVFDNIQELLPGALLSSSESLCRFLEHCLVEGVDEWKDKRQGVRDMFHEVRHNFSMNVIRRLQEVGHLNILEI